MAIKLKFEELPTYYPTAEELATEIDFLLMDAKRQGKKVEGICMSGDDMRTLNHAEMLGHEGAFRTYKGIKIWA